MAGVSTGEGAERGASHERAPGRNAARAHELADARPFEHGLLRIDLVLRRAFVAGAEVKLTTTEYRLLAALVRRAGEVVPYRELLEEVWGRAHAADLAYLRVYIGRLRTKLARRGDTCVFETHARVGYRLAWA